MTMQPTSAPAIVKRVGEYDPETNQYPAYVSIDGESEQLIGCAWSAGAADRLCDEFAYHYFTDNHAPEKAARIVVEMSEPYCFFHPGATDHDTQHCPKLDEEGFGAPSYSVFN